VMLPPLVFPAKGNLKLHVKCHAENYPPCMYGHWS
jgi:hypothetical protein